MEICGKDFAYHSGAMLSDAEVSSPKDCSIECLQNEDCAYWDYEPMENMGLCRLRSNAGNGKVTASGYSYGQRNCIFGKTLYETDMQQDILTMYSDL